MLLVAKPTSTLATWIVLAALPTLSVAACGDDAEVPEAVGDGGQVGDGGSEARAGDSVKAGSGGVAGDAGSAVGGRNGSTGGGEGLGGSVAKGGDAAAGGDGSEPGSAGAGAAPGAGGSDTGEAGAGGAPELARTWRDAELIEQIEASTVGPPAVAYAETGATAIWWQLYGNEYRIVGNRFEAAEPWGTVTPLDQTGAGAYGDPSIVFDPSGNGVAVWVEELGAAPSVRSSRFAEGAWGAAAFIETVDSGRARAPQVAVNASGQAVAVWLKDGDASSGTRYDVWASRYTAGAGWSAPVPLESDDAGSAENPRVAIDGAGNVIAVWAQRDNSTKNIWFSRYAANAWGAATLLENDSTSADDPEIAMTSAGDAVVVWSSSYVWGRVFTADGATWGTTHHVSSTATGQAAQVAFDAHGHAHAVWRQSGNGDPGSIWTNRYTLGTGWAVAAPVVSNETHSAGGPDLAVNAHGDAVVAWQQYDGTRNSIAVSNYRAGQGWGEPYELEEDDRNAYGVQVALGETGEAVVVWMQGNGALDDMWSSRYR